MILLTGGTGFVGRHLIQQCLADSRTIRALSRNPGSFASPPAVAWVRGDLTDPASLPAALDGVTTVIHAAAVLPGGRVPDGDLERINAGGTAALARAARDAGVKRFIHLSSAGVYGEGSSASPHRESDPPAPGTPYERSKLAAEDALTRGLAGCSMSWTMLRPQGLYAGDRPATARQFAEVARRRIWVHGPQRVLVHPTHITDLVAAIRLVLDRDDLAGEVINIGGARALEYPELIRMIGQRMGHGPWQLRAPHWTGRLAAAAAGAWSRLGTPPATLAHLGRRWINRAVNTEKARRLLGFEPVALEWGLDQTARELRQAGAAGVNA